LFVLLAGDVVEMVKLKRTLIIAVILALALGVLGVTTAGAQDQPAKPQKTGTVWLGVTVTDTDAGVTIGEVVAGSPADEAGLKSGDIIQAVDGTSVDSAAALVETIQAHAAGDEITLTVLSNGETSDVKVTLAERPANVEPSAPSYTFGVAPYTMMLNVLGLDTTAQDNGLLINSITADSPLADSGLQAGDVITKINGTSVLERQPRMMFGFRSGEPLVFTVLRDGKEMDITAEVNWQNLQVTPGQPGFNYGQQPTQLGVQFITLTPNYAKENDLAIEQGALVTKVFDNTPAATAGLQADDIITAVNGEVVDEEHTLSDRLYAYEEGDVVTLTVQRGDTEIQIDVTLGPRTPSPMTVPGQGWWFGGPQGQGSHMGPQGEMPYGGRQHGRGRFGTPFTTPQTPPSGPNETQPAEPTPEGQPA
jgi:S1-C subfamily serine protease